MESELSKNLKRKKNLSVEIWVIWVQIMFSISFYYFFMIFCSVKTFKVVLSNFCTLLQQLKFDKFERQLSVFSAWTLNQVLLFLQPKSFQTPFLSLVWLIMKNENGFFVLQKQKHAIHNVFKYAKASNNSFSSFLFLSANIFVSSCTTEEISTCI